MTINANRTRTRLHAASTILADLVDRLPVAVSNANIAITDPDPMAGGEDAPIRRKGWITDPTGQAATSVAMRQQHYLGDLEQQLDSLALTLGLLMAFGERWSPRVTVATRCSGGRTVDDWSRPDCGEFVETYRDAHGVAHEKGHGLCANCRKRRDRWVKAQEETAA